MNTDIHEILDDIIRRGWELRISPADITPVGPGDVMVVELRSEAGHAYRVTIDRARMIIDDRRHEGTQAVGLAYMKLARATPSPPPNKER